MPETTYNLEGRIRNWHTGNFVVKETDSDTANPTQTFYVVPETQPSYNPTPDFLAQVCKPGEHVCYYGNFFSQGEGDQVRVELKVAPSVNGYDGLKKLGDLVAFQKLIAAYFPKGAKVDLNYIPARFIKGEVPSFIANPIMMREPAAAYHGNGRHIGSSPSLPAPF